MIYEIHSAARHNLLQSRVLLLLGNGIGDVGYGQPVLSSSVNPGDTITASQVNALREDILNILRHQLGMVDVPIEDVIAAQNAIAEDTSFFVDPNGLNITDPDGEKKGFSDYETVVNNAIPTRFLVHPSESTTEVKLTSTRTTRWSGTIFHEFGIIFDDQNHRRHFFNTGGEILLNLSFSDSQSPQGDVWGDFISTVSEISFNYNSATSEAAGGVGYNIGNYQLTSDYQQVYSVNRDGQSIVLRSRAVSDAVIQFRVELIPSFTGEDYIVGDMTSMVSQIRAIGDNVSISTPLYTVQRTLQSFPPLI